MTDIIIIGAGASGLNAARILSKAGKSVVVLEARDRIGGRIHTIQESDFSKPVETGAEFMHGLLPTTLDLIREAGIKYQRGEGRMWNVFEGKVEEGDSFNEHWSEMIEVLKGLKKDMSIAQFLNQHFGEKKYDELRESISKFVQGYDAADPDKASAFSLRQEWTSDEDLTGYHLVGGYSQLMNYLQKESINHKAEFHLSCEVNEIQWKENEVKVSTTNGKTFEASKVLITVPPAVLRTNSIKFHPEIKEHSNAIQKIETGGVIKFLVEFHEAYWEKENQVTRYLPEMHFLFSDAFIPTWWSQRPNATPLLTGWLAGPVTQTINKSEEELKSDAIHALAYLLNNSEEELKKKIKAIKVINWAKDPFSLGAYAYRTVETADAMKVLTKSINETLYFAGEAYYDGPEMGTVEAALACGEKRANEIMKH